MSERYFTREEVEALIPTLRDLVARLQSAHADGASAREWMQTEHQRLTIAGGGMLDQDRWRADSTRLEAGTKEAQAALGEIMALGGIVKDIGMGLVDFPGLREGRVVNLCWKQGETDIRWWHGMDEGFSARKPL